MPHVLRDRRVDVLYGDAASVRGVIKRDVVLERVGACHVVVIAVLPAPHHAARLILPARDRLEAYFDEAVLDRRAGKHAPWKGAARRLLQHVRLARGRLVRANRPEGGAMAGDALLPCRRQAARRIAVEVDGVGDGRRSGENARHRNARLLHVDGAIFIGAPTAFHPEWPLFPYRASKPASRSLMVVPQPTWKP